MSRMENANAAPLDQVLEATTTVIEKLYDDSESANDQDTSDTITGYRGVKVLMFWKTTGKSTADLELGPERFLTVDGPKALVAAVAERYAADLRVEDVRLQLRPPVVTILWNC